MSGDVVRGDLAKEIGRAIRSGMDVAFTTAHLNADNSVYGPLLASILAQVFPRTWSKNQNEAFQTAMRLAAEALPGESEYQFADGRVDRHLRRHVTYRELAQLMTASGVDDFNPRRWKGVLEAGRTLMFGTTGDGRLESAKESEFRRNRERVFQAMSEELAAMPQLEPKPGERGIGNYSNEVRRSDIEDRVLSFINDAGGPIALVGESGNGKSFVARQLIREAFSAHRVAEVHEGRGDESLFATDLSGLLRRAGWDQPHQSVADKVDAVREVLKNPAAFDLVLFDNVDLWVLEAVLPDAQVPILITSRERLGDLVAEDVIVPEFTKSQALEASRYLLPGREDIELEALCSDVGNRPVVIHIACHLISEEHLTVENFRRSMAENSAKVLRSMAAELGRHHDHFGNPINGNIVGVYQHTLNHIFDAESDGRGGDPPVADVLDAILWLTESADIEFIYALASDTLTEAEFQRVRGAVSVLARFGLITHRGTSIEINTLTLDVLRHLQGDRAPGTVGRTLSRLRQAAVTFRDRDADWRTLTAHERAAAYRTGFFLAIVHVDGVYESMFPNLPGRVYPLLNTMVAYQDSAFFEPDDERRYGVLTAEISTGELRWLWTSTRSKVGVLDGDQDGGILAMAWLAHCTQRSDYPDAFESSGHVGEMFLGLTRRAQTQFRHVSMSVVPDPIAAHYGSECWTLCGEWQVPSIDYELRLCTRCADLVRPERRLLRLRLGARLISLEKIAENYGSPWNMRLMLMNVLYYVIDSETGFLGFSRFLEEMDEQEVAMTRDLYLFSLALSDAVRRMRMGEIEELRVLAEWVAGRIIADPIPAMNRDVALFILDGIAELCTAANLLESADNARASQRVIESMPNVAPADGTA
ncbi:MAG: hypothetical protein JWP74_520 [Marmoricola sp.]|nr:hypothetical protein [Marmoricola sp.]